MSAGGSKAVFDGHWAIERVDPALAPGGRGVEARKIGSPGDEPFASPPDGYRTRIQHPWPDRRFDARTQGRSPVR
jgi:hypothetical protein